MTGHQLATCATPSMSSKEAPPDLRMVPLKALHEMRRRAERLDAENKALKAERTKSETNMAATWRRAAALRLKRPALRRYGICSSIQRHTGPREPPKRVIPPDPILSSKINGPAI
jgi:hypothetical protein